MTLLLAALFLGSSTALSHSTCEKCEHVRGDPSHELEVFSHAVTSATESLPWYSATPQQTLRAPCKGRVPSPQDMQVWMENNQSQERLNASIHGIQLENESPENIETLRLLLSARDELLNPDPTAQRSFTSQCKKVDCVARELFGETALETLYLQRRYGFNASHLAYTRSVPWKKTELHSAMIGILDFPPGLYPLWKSRPFTRFLPGQLPSSQYPSSTVAEANVRFFDNWANSTEGQRQATSMHEIGHAIAGETRIDYSPQWLKLSGWEQRQTQVNGQVRYHEYATKRSALVSGYGTTSAIEDFAETVAAYRYNAAFLKDRSPEKYEFIKHSIFNGVEYLNESTCSSAHRTSTTLIPEALKGLTNWTPSQAEIEALSKKCVGDVFSSMAASDTNLIMQPEVSGCLNKIPHQRGVDFMLDRVAHQAWGPFMEPMLRGSEFPIPPSASGKVKAIANHLNVQTRNQMQSLMLGTLQRYAPVPNSQSCSKENLKESYRVIGPIYNDPEGRKPYQDRAKIAHALSRVCLSIAASRSPAHANRPISSAEVQTKLRQLFP